MSTYNTDNEIENMLKTVSETLAPSETSFSNLLSKLDTTHTPQTSPYTISSFPFNFIFNPRYAKIASSFAVFVFILGGMIAYKSKTGPLQINPSQDTSTIANSNIPQQTSIPETEKSSNNTVRPSIVASTAQTQTQSTLAVAALKTSAAAAPEATDLQNVLANELNAEITAQTDLLALSDNI